MVIGVCRISLELEAIESLKQKRSIVRRLLDRVRARFNVAAAEVDLLDDHRRAMLGFAVISNDTRHANGMLDKIVDFCEQNGLAEVGSIHVELIPMGRPVGDLMARQSDLGLPAAWKGESSEDAGSKLEGRKPEG